VNQRDTSGEGAFRRKVFGELLGLLQGTGLPLDQARRQLLLTLKVWRNEISPDGRSDDSVAGHARNRLFQELLTRLTGAGLTPDQAREKLLEAVEIWRKAP